MFAVQIAMQLKKFYKYIICLICDFLEDGDTFILKYFFFTSDYKYFNKSIQFTSNTALTPLH